MKRIALVALLVANAMAAGGIRNLSGGGDDGDTDQGSMAGGTMPPANGTPDNSVGGSSSNENSDGGTNPSVGNADNSATDDGPNDGPPDAGDSSPPDVVGNSDDTLSPDVDVVDDNSPTDGVGDDSVTPTDTKATDATVTDATQDIGTTADSVTPTGTDAASHPGRFCGHGTLFDVTTNLCQASYEKFIESCTSDPHGPMCGNHKDEQLCDGGTHSDPEDPVCEAARAITHKDDSGQDDSGLYTAQCYHVDTRANTEDPTKWIFNKGTGSCSVCKEPLKVSFGAKCDNKNRDCKHCQGVIDAYKDC